MTARARALQDVPLGRVSRNSLILFVTNLAVNAVSLPFVAFLARHLGVEEFGTYLVALTFAEFLMIVADMGAGKLLTREISAREGEASAVVGAVLLPKPLLFSAVLAGGLLVGAGLGYSGPQLVPIGLAAGIASLRALATAGRSVFHAYQHMEYDAVGLVSERIVTIGFAIAASWAGYGIRGVLAACLLGGVVDVLLTWMLVRCRLVSGFLAFDLRRAGTYLRSGFPLFVAFLSSTAYMRASVVILERTLGSHAAAWFGAAYQVLVLALFLPQVLGVSIFPVFSRMAKEDIRSLEKLCRTWAWAMGLGGLLVAGCLIALAGLVIPFVYSEQFLPSVGLLRILALGLPFAFASSILIQVLVAANRQRVVGQAMVCAAVTNIGLNLVLIPVLGVQAAALVSVFTQALFLAHCMFAILRPDC